MTTRAGTIEYWFTAPSKAQAEELIRQLAEQDISFSEPPFPLVAEKLPARPWTVVGQGSPGIDPTLVAAIALESDSRYHPDGGYGRWDQPD